MQVVWTCFQNRICLSCLRTRSQRTGRRDGDERERHPGHRPRARHRQKHRLLDAKEKSAEVVAVNPHVGSRHLAVETGQHVDPPVNSQADEQWGHVRKKKNPRWLWHAIDAATGSHPVIRVRAAQGRGVQATHIKPESFQHSGLLHGRLGKLCQTHSGRQAHCWQEIYSENRKQKPFLANAN